MHRFKLLAGPRWTGDAAEGSVKISEERFPDGRMNRVSVVEMLERLVAAANVSKRPVTRSWQDEKSPLPADAPLDTRHVLAKERKSSRLSRYWKRAEAMRARPDTVGGVQGFPKEWLA